MMRDSFSSFHPLNNLIYFMLVIGFSLAFNNPLAQGISLVSACIYAITANGKKSGSFILKYCLPTVFITALINPAFNHRGATVLLYIGNGTPLTLESVLYGISAGIILVTIMVWFVSFSRVMTSDKFIYLFGKIIPAISLVLSMTLRFVPKFKNQTKSVIEAQRCIGRDISAGSLWQKTKTVMLVFSIMVTWSLENAVETADSMKNRGYGLKGRTAFSIYKFNKKDVYILAWLTFCGLFLFTGGIMSIFNFGYFPKIGQITLNFTTFPFYVVFFALCITPVAINVKEELKWKTLISKM